MGNAVRFRQSAVPRQQGELARLKVVQGADYGTVYVLIGPRATIGRGEESDVMVSDLKASRTHAVLQWASEGWKLQDAGSANGILLNGAPVRTALLKVGDIIVLGETTLEFQTAEQGTQMLLAPARAAGQVQAEQAAFRAQQERVRAMGRIGPPAGVTAGAGGGSGSKRTMIYALAGGVFALLYLVPSTPPSAPKPSRPARDPAAAGRELAAYLPQSNHPPSRAAEMFFKAGYREFMLHNFLRAQTNFETALQISPTHVQAMRYLEAARKEIDKEVKFHLDKGRKGLDAGRLKEARGHFESVLRLLHRDQTNDSFKTAREQLEAVNRQIRGEVKP